MKMSIAAETWILNKENINNKLQRSEWELIERISWIEKNHK